MGLTRDLRYALRTLARSPGYALLCAGVLALGVGANAAIFSVLDSVVLEPLPYPDPERLVFVWEQLPSMPAPFDKRMEVARRNYEEWKRQNTVFSDMAAFTGATLDETLSGHPRHVSTVFASPNLLSMLGAKPRLGRLFSPGEERPGADRVALLSDEYFDRRFHRDPGALGRTVVLGGSEYVVIGVLPARFHLPGTLEGLNQLKPEVWLPLSRLWKNQPEDDTMRRLMVAARLKPGVTLARARTEVAGIARRLEKSDPELNKGWKTSVFPFAVEDSSPKVRRGLYVLMGAVGFLLLIACANLANLTLARATLRSREIAVRLAMGATRARIVAQLVTESFVVSLAGAGLGLLLAHWSIKLMLALKPEDIGRPELIGINFPVLAFAAGVSVLTTVLFGLAPSLAASRTDLNTGLKSGATWGASAARVRSRQFLIALETALALMLMVGAGLMVRSFQALLSVGVGFATERIATADIDLPKERYSDAASRARFCKSLIERAGAIPGVSGAAVVDSLPLHRLTAGNFYIAGRPDPPVSSAPIADLVNSSPGYLSLIGLRLEAGRFFTPRDIDARGKGADVVMVNRSFARKFFPGENPLGKRILDGEKRAFEIVGIVSDYRPMGVENGNRATIFWPSLELGAATLLVRSAGRGAPAEAIREAIWSVDKDLAAPEIVPLQHYFEMWLSQRKFNTLLLKTFAGLALILGIMGIYGVLSNLVTSRTREIGIRMAIGASPAQVGRLVLRQGMVPVSIGIAVGVAGSLALGRFLEALLFQVRGRDPLTIAAAVCAILLVAPAAIYVPLRRATRVDCTVALREE